MTVQQHGTSAAIPEHEAPASASILQFLSELSRQSAIEQGDIESLITYVVAHVRDLIDADYVGVWLFDEGRQNLHSVLRYDVREGKPTAPVVLPAARVDSEFAALRHSPLLAIDDARSDPRAADYRDIFLVPHDITALLDHAIRAAGEDVGVFSIERCGASRRPWSPSEMALVRSISNYLSLAYVNRQRRRAETALRQSEQRLRTLTDNLPGAVYQRPVSPEAPFAYVSGGMSRFTGDQPVMAHQAGARNWSSFIHPDDLARVATAYANGSNTEYTLEYRVRRDDGEEMWVLDKGRGSPREDTSPQDGVMLDGVLFNITPRKRAEEVALAATALQTAILSNVAYAVIATDAKGTITFFNRAAEDLLGYAARELVGLQTPLIFHDLKEIQQRIETMRQCTGRDDIYPFEIFTADTRDQQPSENEWTYIRKDGKRLTARLSNTAMRAATGEVIGFLGIATDISDRKLLALRLRQSEDIANQILMQSPDAILITSLKDGRILEANPGFEQITGIPRENALGRSTVELKVWANIDERNQMLEQVRDSGMVDSLPIRIVHRDRGTRYCAMWARVFTFDGEPALLSVVHDVTELRIAAESARKSERMLQAVLDAVPSHVFWKDRESRYLGCNRQFALDNGHENPAELIGTTDYDQLTARTPEQLAEIATVLEADRQVVATGEATQVRNSLFVMQDGSKHWMRVTKAPLRDADGNITGILGVQHDVTEILHSVQKAQDAEKMLRTVLDAIPSRVYWKDRNSIYLGCNQMFVNDTGLGSDAAVIGRTDDDLPWRDLAGKLQAVDREIMASGEAQVGQLGLYQGPSGAPRWFETTKLPLIGVDGGVYGVLGVANDVTEQRIAVNQLRANEEKLRSLFETSPLGVTLSGVDGMFLEINDAFLKIIGYDRADIADLSYQKITPPEYIESDKEQVDILAKTGHYGPYDKEYIRRDGSRIAVSINGSTVTGPDGVQYVWSTVEDITIRRAAEQAERQLKGDLERLVAERTSELKSAMAELMRAEKLASLGSLVAGVAHEISTPVGNASLATSTMNGSIADFERVMAEKLTRTALDGFVQQIKLGTEIANRNIERVAGLIQSFKQVAVDQTSSQRRQFQLTEIVDEIATTMHPSLKRSAVTLNITVPGDITLDSYPGPLGQILTNLINNSLVHAFPAGRSGVIRIAASRIGADSISLLVGDDGIGIPAGVIGRIFDPFFTSKLGRGGSGLGLHIVHNIITGILAGTISVASEEGRGTTFTLTLPRISPMPQEPA